MLSMSSISNLFLNKQFSCKYFTDHENGVLNVESDQKADEVSCPICGGKVHIHDHSDITLKDMPPEPDTTQLIKVRTHRYQCQSCSHSFNDFIAFKYPGTRVTMRAAAWIKAFLGAGMTIKAVSRLTGIHWGDCFQDPQRYHGRRSGKKGGALKDKGYKPKRLAVDEFAIHKGHTYATCVMDIDEGDVIG